MRNDHDFEARDIDTDLETRLRRDLHERSANLAPRGAGPASARRAGARRRRRQQLMSVTVCVTLVGAATATVVATRDPADPADVNVGGAAVTDEQAATAPPFDWSVLDARSELGDAQSVVTGADGTLYALSTAPGVSPLAPGADWTPPPQTLYTSADGTTWQDRPVRDLWIGALAERDGVLYALGTAPATAAVDGGSTVAAVAARSSDGGGTWTQSVLPLALDGAGPSGSSRHVASTSVASGPAGVVAAVSTFDDFDLSSLLPAGADAGFGVEPTPTGLDVFGPVVDLAAVAAQSCPTGWTAAIVDGTAIGSNAAAVKEGVSVTTLPPSANAAVPVPVSSRGGGAVRCSPPDGGSEPLFVPRPFGVVATYTWAELGVDPATGATYGQPTQHLFVTDGDGFQEVTAPFGTGAQVELLATTDGYVALATAFQERSDPKGGAHLVTAWHSTDGRAWTRLDVPELTDVAYVVAAAVRDGQLVVIDGAGRILRSTDGRTWAATSVDDTLGASLEPGEQAQVLAGGIGPAGIAVAVQTHPLVASGTPVTRDGVTLELTDTGGVRLLDAATGAVLAEIADISRSEVTDVVRVDADTTTIVVYDPATGAERARFRPEDVKGAFSEPSLDAGSTRLVTSTDGEHFGSTPLADLIGGAEGFVSWISVSDRVLVNVARPTDGAGPGERVLLVGTPPR